MRKTLGALCDAWAPKGGPVPEGARELGVPEELEALTLSADLVTKTLIKGMVSAVEVAPVFSPHGRRLSSLSPGAASEYLNLLEDKGGAVGSGVYLLRHLVEGLFSYSPQVRSAIGVDLEPSRPLPAPIPAVPTTTYKELGVKALRECDACVIGSGAGGAPVAKVLAEAGWKVIVIEEGRAYSRVEFKGSPMKRMAEAYRGNGVMMTLGSPTISLVEAVAVGGTTVFNSGSCFRTPDDVLKRWSSEFSLKESSSASMSQYFDRVEKMLSVGEPDPAILGGNAEVARKGAAILGLEKHGVIRRPAPGCMGSDECVVGCPTDAKQSMALTYLPAAVMKGAQVISNARVRTVRRKGGGKFRWSVDADLGFSEAGRGRGSLRVDAKFVVLAAGALHTPYLMPAAGDPRSRRHRGQHLRIHPSFEVAGEMDSDVRGWKGVLQSYYVEDYAKRILLEATFQPRGILSSAGLIPLAGEDYKRYIPKLGRLAILGGMICESSEGHLLPMFAGRPWARYDLSVEDLTRLGNAFALAGKVLFAAGARKVFLPLGKGVALGEPAQFSHYEGRPVDKSKAHLFAFHPLGTARMAGEPGLGAVDEHGRVWGTDGLAVSDASTLPGSPFVNPMISIIAFAERNAERWVKEGLGA